MMSNRISSKRRYLLLIAGIVLVGAVVAVTMIPGYYFGKEPELEGGSPMVRRLTNEQYVNSIADIFGPDITFDADFEPLIRSYGDLLASATSNIAVSPVGYERFDATARKIASQVVDEAHRDLLVPCQPVSAVKPDNECSAAFFTRVGRQLYRRPLTDEEIALQVNVAGEATEQTGDFYTGLELSLASMLTSPNFIFRVESVEGDPENPGQVRLTGYSKASRLSYFFWNTTPDNLLLDAAEKGDLHDPEKLAGHIERLAASPRLVHGVRAFFKDMLHFERFDILGKDPVIYPYYSALVAKDMEEQILRTLTAELLDRQSAYPDAFTTNKTFLNRRLGVIFAAPVKSAEGWEAYESPEASARSGAGILGLPGFLAMHAHAGRSSPTLRGIAVRELLMCQHVPDPPANVNFAEIGSSEAEQLTARDRLSLHNTSEACASCHKIMDPIGLTLEHFDGVGLYRETENGAVLDVSGEIDGVEFDGARGLGRALHDNPDVTSCLIKRLYEYGIGKPYPNPEEVIEAEKWLHYMANSFEDHDYKMVPLMREIASSEAFFDIDTANGENAETAALTHEPDSDAVISKMAKE